MKRDLRPETSELRTRKTVLVIVVAVLTCLFVCTARASVYDDAKSQIMSGKLEAGAQMLVKDVEINPTPESLLLLAKTLDRLSDVFTERIEMACYWGKSRAGDPACAQAQTDKLNSIYGAGAFKFITDIAYVPYTGVQYNQLIDKYPKSSQADEAAFWLLLKNLVGQPDSVLDRVKKFLDKHPSGDVNRKALLLWARVNEDLWCLYRGGTMAFVNQKYSPDLMSSRAAEYQKNAIDAYKKLVGKSGDSFEKTAAKRELETIKKNLEDGKKYSILQETIGGSPGDWGSDIPKPALKATSKGIGEPGWKKPTSPSDIAPEVEEKK